MKEKEHAGKFRTWLSRFHNHRSKEGKRGIRFWQHFPYLCRQNKRWWWADGCIAIELYIANENTKRLACEATVSNEGDSIFHFNLAIPFLFNFHFSLDVLPPAWLHWWMNNPKKAFGKYATYSTGFSASKDWISLDFMRSQNDSSLNKWYSLHKGWFVEDILFGKFDTTKVLESTHTIEFTVPAMKGYEELKTYATVIVERYTREYKRIYMRDMIFYRTDIIIPDDAPKPMRQGKGENSWDCDPVAMGNISYGGRFSPQETVEKFLADVRRDRKRYG